MKEFYINIQNYKIIMTKSKVWNLKINSCFFMYINFLILVIYIWQKKLIFYKKEKLAFHKLVIVSESLKEKGKENKYDQIMNIKI